MGSLASEAIGAGGQSMSAVPPIASKFYAPQRKTPSATALNRFAIVAAVGSPLCILTRKEIADSEAGFLS